MPRKYGALPPPESAWQIGKTAASIAFVNDALRYVATCIDTEEIAKLQTAIADIKIGKTVLTDWLTPEEFLQ